MDKEVERFWEIDLLRGVAVFMMITFHLIFDLYFFGDRSIEVNQGLWFFLARATATIFILLVGISMTLSYSRVRDHLSSLEIYKKYLKRGGFIFSLGLAITVMTYLFLGTQGFIIFGILHFIGVSIVISVPLLRKKYLNLILSFIFISAGFLIRGIRVEHYWLVWLGFRPSPFYTVDYFPLLPWFGLITFGLFLGRTLYPEYERIFELPELSGSRLVSPICFVGRNSLKIYLLHQPLLIISLHLLGVVNVFEELSLLL